MRTISPVRNGVYAGTMVRKQQPRVTTTSTPRSERRGRRSPNQKPQKFYPNRIHELVKKAKTTYERVAEKISELHPERTKTATSTISHLANGKMKLTPEWMALIAEALNVRKSEIIEIVPGTGLRMVRVTGPIQGHLWSVALPGWPDAHQYDVAVRDDNDYKHLVLYGREVQDQCMNLHYPIGTVLVISQIVGKTPNEIIEGRRYHIRVTRNSDNHLQESIRKLVKAEDGRYWLRPESDHPNFQEWIPYEGLPGETVEILGRVRFRVQRED